MRFTHPDPAREPRRGRRLARAARRRPGRARLLPRPQRVHVGDRHTVADQAYTAWAADRAAGLDAIMLAPTRDLVTRAEQPRPHRPPRQPTRPTGAGSGAGRRHPRQRRGPDPHPPQRPPPHAQRDGLGEERRPLAVTDSPPRRRAARSPTCGTGRHVTLPAGYVAAQVDARVRRHRARRARRHRRHLPRRRDRPGIPAAALRRHDPRPARQPRLPRHRRRRRPAHDHHPRRAAATHRRSTCSPGSWPATGPVSATQPPTALLADPATRLGRSRRPLPPRAARRRRRPPRHRPASPRLDRHRGTCVAGAHRSSTPTPPCAPTWPLLILDGDDPPDCSPTLPPPRGLGRRPRPRRGPGLAPATRPGPQPHRGRGPLPWLPAIPAALATDPHWASYLSDRVHLVTELAAHRRPGPRLDPDHRPAVGHARSTDHGETGPAGRPGRLARREQIDPTPPDRTGPRNQPPPTPETNAPSTTRQTRLARRAHRPATAPFGALAAQPSTRASPPTPTWPTLADRLAAAHRAGIDIATLARSVADAPLPDEQPAAALWWRLRGTCPPPRWPPPNTRAGTLRPDWTPHLAAVVGDQAAARIMADPAWPALVAAVTHAADHTGNPTRCSAPPTACSTPANPTTATC